MPTVSVLISSHNRANLLRRTLYSIEKNPPSNDYEVIIADDDSAEDIVSLLEERNFRWKFIATDRAVLEKNSGLKHYYNNPAHTNNVAFAHSEGDIVFLVGNDIIITPGCFDKMINEDGLVFSTTYDLRPEILAELDEYGGLTKQHIISSAKYPLQSISYRSDVTNYCSAVERWVWEKIGGYDERYIGGIAAEDSDFTRRVRAIPLNTCICSAVSLHQYHGGKTIYYDPTNVKKDFWDEGVRRNREIFHNWNGSYKNPQTWEPGIGVKYVKTG